MTNRRTLRPTRFHRAALAALALAAAACGGAPGVEGEPDDGHGQTCALDAECGPGAHCGTDGRCADDCGPENACADGLVCADDGRCVDQGDDEGVVDVDDGSEPRCDAETICAAGGLVLENRTPTIVLLVDQSGSMREAFGADGASRWDTLRDALVDPTTGIVAALENDVRFGLALYTNDRDVDQCPMLTEVATSMGNHSTIASVYAAARPAHDTPTAESLGAVAEHLAGLADPGPKAILLATDGRPDTCQDPDAHDEGSRRMSIAAARSARERGIATHVISVGTDVGAEHLADLANAGAGLEVGGPEQAPYYEVTEQAALRAALEKIVAGVRSCVFDLDAAVSAADVARGTVTLDGVPVERDDVDGWRLSGEREITLSGAACEQLTAGSHVVKAEFPCPCEAWTPPAVR